MFYRILTALTVSTMCLAQCSQDMVRGSWATYFLGTTMVTPADGSAAVATPAAQVTVVKIDYQGNFTGTVWGVIGAQLMTGTISGNLQVNPDCTASDTYTVNVAGAGPLPGTGSERLVVLNNGGEMRAMNYEGVVGQSRGDRLLPPHLLVGSTVHARHGPRSLRVQSGRGLDPARATLIRRHVLFTNRSRYHRV